MHRTTIYLDSDLHDAVQRMAEARGRTQSAVIREALEAFTKGARRLPRSLGLGKSEDGDLSERVDELLPGMGDDR